MKINKKLIIPYVLAIGFWNLIFTSLITIILVAVLAFPLTGRMLVESFTIGFIVLFILNLRKIRE